jgi:hypothetical protein
MAFLSPAAAKVIYVDTNAPGPTHDGSSWANAYHFLQDALADAGSAIKPVEILVAQGIYKPDSGIVQLPGDRTATFQLINGVSLMGGYAGFGELDPNERDIKLYETTLSGDLDGNDVQVNDPCDLPNEPTRAENSYHVITGSGTAPNAVLDGFTIIGGNSNEDYTLYPHSHGGGMFNEFCDPTVINCTFKGNCARVGAGMCNRSNSPTTINCIFISNSADYGGGIYNFDSIPTIKNCTFICNSALYGAGIYNTYLSNLLVTGCTFISNSAENEGGGIYNYSYSHPIMTNCIFWYNTPDEICNYENCSSDVTYSNIQGGWSGLGNIDTDPCFADANNGDYHLKSQAGRWNPNSQSWVLDNVTSPCIDSGNPGCPLRDEPNGPNNVRINMGAYGGTAEASKSPANWRSIADITNDWVIDSNDLKVFVSYWLQTDECIPSDLDRSRSVDFNDFAIFGGQWQQKGPDLGIIYEIGGCIPAEFGLSATGQMGPARFTITVLGQYIRFEDMMRANCCADEIELQMTLEEVLITINEIEHTPLPPCPCMCDYPITATLGPFQPGTYTLEVYQNSTFIGATTVTIENGR